MPFNKIMVDSRHTSEGTSTKFSVSLPETITLPPHAACICTDVCMTNSMVTLGTHTSGSIKNKFYFIERIGPVGSATTVLDVAILDSGKSYSADTLATEIQQQMNAVSILGPLYVVAYDHDTESMTYTVTTTADLNSSFILTDDLLATPELQSTLICRTGPALVEWFPDYNRPQSAMQFVGGGRGSTRSISWASLQNMLAPSNLLLRYDQSGMVDVRRCHCVYLHSSTLTNYKCVGPAGSRTCLAKIPVTSGSGSVLTYSHSGNLLDNTPCGGVTLSTLEFDLRNAEGQPVDLRGGFVSFTLIFVALN